MDLNSRIGRQKSQIKAVAPMDIKPAIIIVLAAPMLDAQNPTQIVPTLLAVEAVRNNKENARPRM